MKDSKQPPMWPPLVGAVDVPVWIQVRDALLTVGAWGVLIWLAQDLWLHALDLITPPFFVTTFSAAPDWVQILADLRPFLILAEILLVFLLLTAVGRRRHLQRQGVEQPPAALAWDTHLADPIAAIEDPGSRQPQAWHEGVITITFNDKAQVSGVKAGHQAR